MRRGWVAVNVSPVAKDRNLLKLQQEPQMTTNDVLRRLCFALKLSDPAMLEMLELAGKPQEKELWAAYFIKEEEPGYTSCPDAVLEALLDGMIVKYRGRKEDAPGGSPQQSSNDTTKAPGIRSSSILDNNMILKKLRIALELKEEDLMAIMKLAGVELSTHELSALFRKKDHKNYKPCMDQFLRNFLAGLAKYDVRKA
jgi:uncharacterized protein YehS (DUF1456 family)